ncbi:hypothetical protein Tco_0075422, partial [Tanacetum coccineum]
PSMLHVSAPSTSPSRITSSPSHSPEHSPSPEPSPTPSPSPEPSPTPSPSPSPKPSHTPDHTTTAGSLKLNELTDLITKLSDRIGVLEDDLRKIKKTYSYAFTKLILRVKKLEARVKIGKSRKRAKFVLSEDDEDIADDSSKQGRKLSDAEVQEKAKSSEKGQSEVSSTGAKQGTASEEVSLVSTAGEIKDTASEVLIVSTAGEIKDTASEVPIVSTAEVNLSTAGGTVTYTRKDKGKAIMTEPEPKKKSKKEIEQERLSFAKAIRLEEQMNEE